MRTHEHSAELFSENQLQKVNQIVDRDVRMWAFGPSVVLDDLIELNHDETLYRPRTELIDLIDRVVTDSLVGGVFGGSVGRGHERHLNDLRTYQMERFASRTLPSHLLEKSLDAYAEEAKKRESGSAIDVNVAAEQFGTTVGQLTDVLQKFPVVSDELPAIFRHQINECVTYRTADTAIAERFKHHIWAYGRIFGHLASDRGGIKADGVLVPVQQFKLQLLKDMYEDYLKNDHSNHAAAVRGMAADALVRVDPLDPTRRKTIPVDLESVEIRVPSKRQLITNMRQIRKQRAQSAARTAAQNAARFGTPAAVTIAVVAGNTHGAAANELPMISEAGLPTFEIGLQTVGLNPQEQKIASITGLRTLQESGVEAVSYTVPSQSDPLDNFIGTSEYDNTNISEPRDKNPSENSVDGPQKSPEQVSMIVSVLNQHLRDGNLLAAKQSAEELAKAKDYTQQDLNPVLRSVQRELDALYEAEITQLPSSSDRQFHRALLVYIDVCIDRPEMFNEFDEEAFTKISTHASPIEQLIYEGLVNEFNTANFGDLTVSQQATVIHALAKLHFNTLTPQDLENLESQVVANRTVTESISIENSDPEIIDPQPAETAPQPEKPAETQPEKLEEPPVSEIEVPDVLITEVGEYITGDLAEKMISHYPFYVEAAAKHDLPWELIATVHYRETNFSRENPGNKQGLFQFYAQRNTDLFPPGPVTDENFRLQLDMLGEFLRGKAAGGVVDERLSAKPSDDLIKDTLFGYNGRANAYVRQAAALGYNPDTHPFEGSPYVMNLYDEPRTGHSENWGQIRADGGPLIDTDDRPGAFLVYEQIKQADIPGKIKAQQDAAAEVSRQKKEEANQKTREAAEEKAAEERRAAEAERAKNDYKSKLPDGKSILNELKAQYGEKNSGNIDKSKVKELPSHFWSDSQEPESLHVDAYQSFIDMNEAFKRDTGRDFKVNDGCRSYEKQQKLHDKYGSPRAAKPGTSDHGWCLAVDIDTAGIGFDSVEYKWMVENGEKYGWVHPSWAKPGAGNPEAWHYEFQGSGTHPNGI